MHTPSTDLYDFEGEPYAQLGSLSVIAAAYKHGADALEIFTAHPGIIPAIISFLMRANNPEAIMEFANAHPEMYSWWERFIPGRKFARAQQVMVGAAVEGMWMVNEQGNRLILAIGKNGDLLPVTGIEVARVRD